MGQSRTAEVGITAICRVLALRRHSGESGTVSGGIGLIVIGGVMWLLAYYLPRRINWPEKSSSLASIRNRPGEAIARVLGPALIVLGLVVAIASAA